MIEGLPPVAQGDPSKTDPSLGDPSQAAPSPLKSPPDPAGQAGGPAMSGSEPGATRLTVEQDGTGVYVYRLFDTVTGRLLAEVPRERADELKGSPDYAAGDLVSTSA